MKIEQAAEIRFLLNELDRLNHIKVQTEEEGEKQWWLLVTPKLRSYNDGGLVMPDILRDEFVKAVDRCIEQLEKQIEEL